MAALREHHRRHEFALRLLGPIGAAIASAAVMCSVFGALNGNFSWGRDCSTPWAKTGWRRGARHGSRPISNTGDRHPSYGGLGIALGGGGGGFDALQLPIVHVGSLAIDLNVPPNKALFDL